MQSADASCRFLLLSIQPFSVPAPLPRIAYLGQPVWIQSGRLRDNIQLASTWDAEWFSRVVSACQLTSDLDHLPSGPDTMVGEAGSRLSGGQRTRVALARALYQRADLALLDDPLSGLDTHVARQVATQCLGKRGLFAACHTARVIVMGGGSDVSGVISIGVTNYFKLNASIICLRVSDGNLANPG
ncbi:unnamed protein product [Protopolystoma xenopodis]|uniref:ABC transporter domain-containing protein n=1 Tax=Protopolystoma xenopodis TaxID=117903 RepID=A0A3S5AJT2_9PLAT|nr:unnamed protein product [Protopolystoma xenopodis]